MVSSARGEFITLGTRMKKNILAKSLFVVAALLPHSLAIGAPISEDDVLRETMSKSASIRAIDAEIAAKLGEAISLRTLSNPELEGGIAKATHEAGDPGDNEYEISLSQPLRVSQFGTRQLVSRLMNKAATEQQKLSVLELTENTRLSYAELWAFEEAMQRIKAATERGERYAKQILSGKERGLFADGEVKLFEAEALRRKAELLSIEAVKVETLSKLVRLSGVNLTDRTLTKPSAIKLSSKEEILSLAEKGELPIQARQRLQAELASKQFALARRDSLPAFAPRIAFQHTDDGDDRIVAGFSMELPFFDRNQGERVEKQAVSNSERVKSEYFLSDSFRSEILAALKRTELKSKESALIENQIIPSLKTALSSFETQLKAGQGVLLQLWESQRELADVEREALEVWFESRKAQSELRVLLGGEI